MNNLINNFMAMARNGANPRAIAESMLMNDPQARAVLEQMQNMAGGLSPRDFALRYAKQNGISEAEVLNVAKQFGLN